MLSFFFVTNMPQYAVQGYEVNAFDYIVKPVQYFPFSVKLSAAIQLMQEEAFSIIIPGDDEEVLVKANEVIFIEIRDHWLYIQTKEDEYRMLGSLKEMEVKLKDHHFIRCNKSYLINLQYVTRMKSDNITLHGNYQVKMSRARRKEVQFAFIDYFSEQKG